MGKLNTQAASVPVCTLMSAKDVNCLHCNHIVMLNGRTTLPGYLKCDDYLTHANQLFDVM